MTGISINTREARLKLGSEKLARVQKKQHVSNNKLETCFLWLPVCGQSEVGVAMFPELCHPNSVWAAT